MLNSLLNLFGASNIEDLFIPLAVFAGTMTVILLIMAAANKPVNKSSKSRIRNVTNRRKEVRQEALADKKNRSSIFSDKFVKEMVNKNVKNKDQVINDYAAKMSQAGFRDRNAAYRHIFYKFAWALLMPVVGFLVVFFIWKPEWSLLYKFTAVAVCGLLGFMMPDFALKKRIEKRVLPIKRNFPDALDMLVVCAESGLGIDAGLKRVSQELSTGCPELSEELAITSIELSFFEERREALENLSKRINIPQVKSFVSTMMQTEKYGTPVAHSLRVLSNEFRQERMMEAEAKAAQLPAKMTVPLILCILPPLMVVLIGPAILSMMDTFGG